MKDRKRLRRRILPLLAVLMLLSAAASGALASGSWMTFTMDSVPENLGFLVQEYTGTVRVTFLGDCTLGGEEKSRKYVRGFDQPLKDLIFYRHKLISLVKMGVQYVSMTV